MIPITANLFYDPEYGVPWWMFHAHLGRTCVLPWPGGHVTNGRGVLLAGGVIRSSGSLPICLLPLLITEGQGPNFPRTVWMYLFLLSALSFLLDVFWRSIVRCKRIQNCYAFLVNWPLSRCVRPLATFSALKSVGRRYGCSSFLSIVVPCFTLF